MLELSNIQKKILNVFFEKRDTTIVHHNPQKHEKEIGIFEYFESMIRGLTSYDLEKNGVLRRTWDINREFLIKNQLVHLIRERKTGQQIRKFYDITPLGVFSLLQNEDQKSLKENFIKKYSKFVPFIAKKWNELEKEFGENLFYILERSSSQISWYPGQHPGIIKEYPKSKKEIDRKIKRIRDITKNIPESEKEIIGKINKAIQYATKEKNYDLLNQISSELFEFLKVGQKIDWRAQLVFAISELIDELNKPYEKFIHQNKISIMERTVFWFESIEIILRRKYLDFASTKNTIQRRVERTEKWERLQWIYPKPMYNTDFREPANDIMLRFVLVFYHNLLILYHNEWIRLDIAGDIWYEGVYKKQSQEELKKTLEEMNRKKLHAFDKMDNEKYKISRDLYDASKNIAMTIKKDQELKKIINEVISEINSKISELKTKDQLLPEIE